MNSAKSASRKKKKKLIMRKEAKRGHGHESKPTPNVGNLSVYCFSHVERTKILEAFKTSKVLNWCYLLFSVMLVLQNIGILFLMGSYNLLYLMIEVFVRLLWHAWMYELSIGCVSGSRNWCIYVILFGLMW